MDKKEKSIISKLKSIVFEELSSQDLFKCAFRENFWN